MMILMDIEHTTSRVIAIARSDQGLTAAYFDYDVSVHGIGHGPGDPIMNAIYKVANEHMPPVTSGADSRLDERVENARRLREQLQPALDRYEVRCRSRKYTGWSKESAGPIRYAD